VSLGLPRLYVPMFETHINIGFYSTNRKKTVTISVTTEHWENVFKRVFSAECGPLFPNKCEMRLSVRRRSLVICRVIQLLYVDDFSRPPVLEVCRSPMLKSSPNSSTGLCCRAPWSIIRRCDIPSTRRHPFGVGPNDYRSGISPNANEHSRLNSSVSRLTVPSVPHT